MNNFYMFPNTPLVYGVLIQEIVLISDYEGHEPLVQIL